MAIVTGDLYKGFTFGDISSKTYGVYITQEAAYNAPDRDVEVVEIAGRNGAYILDKGRFRNITVSYKCGIALDDEQSFESAIRTFRNALASKAGKYVRLEDEYNTNEFRQAAFLGGIEVDMADRRAGEFTVSFDAMPQRFLKSGETAVAVASGGTLTNPTLFESHPLLQVWGYGNIGINDDTITIADDVIGDILLSPAVHSMPYANYSQSMLRANDIITVNSGTEVLTVIQMDGGAVFHAYRSEIYSDVDHIISRLFTHISNGAVSVRAEYNPVTFHAMDMPRQYDATVHTYIEYTPAGGTRTSITYEIHYSIQDLSVNSQRRIQVASAVITSDPTLVWYFTPHEIGEITAYSTKSALGEPLYFDLDIGEAYKIENNEVISVNNAVSFPAQLPTLKSGNNTITYENTVDQFKVVPRWWEV